MATLKRLRSMTARKILAATMPTKNAATHSMVSIKRSMPLRWAIGGAPPEASPPVAVVASRMAILVQFPQAASFRLSHDNGGENLAAVEQTRRCSLSIG